MSKAIALRNIGNCGGFFAFGRCISVAVATILEQAYSLVCERRVNDPFKIVLSTYSFHRSIYLLKKNSLLFLLINRMKYF